MEGKILLKAEMISLLFFSLGADLLRNMLGVLEKQWIQSTHSGSLKLIFALGRTFIPRLLLIFGDLGNENSLIFSIFTVSSIEFTANFVFLSSYSWPGGCETLFATKARWWLMFNLLPTRTLKSDSVEESHFQVQVSAIPFVELHKIPAGPFLQPVEAALKGDTSIWFIGHSSHCCNSTAPLWQYGSQALPFWGDSFLALFLKWKEFSQSWSYSTCPSVSNI